MDGAAYGAALDLAAFVKSRIAINADLVEALEALLGPEDDPNIGWRGTAQTSSDHFRCEHCGVEDLDSVKLPHKDDCLLVKARAALSRAKEQM